MRRSFRSLPLAPLSVLLALVLAALFAGLIAPHDPQHQDLLARLTPPAWVSGGSPHYLLGTDGLGRDILSNVLYGLQVSLLVGFLSVAISIAIGGTAGLVAGYLSGGWFDAVVMPLVDLQLSVPAVLIALAVMA
ncbi:MAG: ABC transporter permease, partial [Acetobacteraceae bacterium]